MIRAGLGAASVIAVIMLVSACHERPDEPDALRRQLTVLSFNIWGAGANTGERPDLTLSVLKTVNADIVALQETRGEAGACTGPDCAASGESVAGMLAKTLGYHVYEQDAENAALWSSAILSRFPIVSATPHQTGVILDVDGRQVAVFNIHLNDYPYQPYQLLGIPYDDAPFIESEAEAIAAASRARGAGLDLLFSDINDVRAADMIIVCGDFNEPSHLDWTGRAARAGHHPIAVQYPASRRLAVEGFVDTFRQYFADEVAKPGFTWTPLAGIDAPNEHLDRIDFIYIRGASGRVESAAVVGEPGPVSDVAISPWPSDHRAVLATVSYQAL